ncbi:hypothetical protein ACFQU1_07105 [Chelatococcus sp. GCM10030263]|uniref:hypothetical protein n=1 Tax=Chelatococcus sp. GCM10030263 TaxID=3273387 RepID=UPI003615A3F1
MRRLIAVLLVLAAASSPGLAEQRMPLDLDPIPLPSSLPACDSVAVLGKISSEFASKESEYWHSNLQLAFFERIRMIAWKPWGEDFVPRRFCKAVSLVTDGVKREVIYSVRAGLGGIGLTWDVEWCVRGIDRGWSYAPWCKMALP